MADFYFSTSGDDSTGDGSQGDPWQNPWNKMASFAAGNKFLLKRGDEWTEVDDTAGFSVWQFFTKDATSGSHFTVEPYDTGADPILDARDSIDSWADQGSNIWESDAHTFVDNNNQHRCWIDDVGQPYAGDDGINDVGSITSTLTWSRGSGASAPLSVYSVGAPTNVKYLEHKNPRRWIEMKDASYIDFNNIVFRGAHSALKIDVTTPGDTHHIVFDGCTFQDSAHRSSIISNAGGTDITIQNFICDKRLGVNEGIPFETPNNNAASDGFFISLTSDIDLINGTLTDFNHTGLECRDSTNILAQDLTFQGSTGGPLADGTVLDYWRALTMRGTSVAGTIERCLIDKQRTPSPFGGGDSMVYRSLVFDTHKSTHPEETYKGVGTISTSGTNAAVGLVKAFNITIFNGSGEAIQVRQSTNAVDTIQYKNMILYNNGGNADAMAATGANGPGILHTQIRIIQTPSGGDPDFQYNCIWSDSSADVINHLGTARTIAEAESDNPTWYANNIGVDPVLNETTYRPSAASLNGGGVFDQQFNDFNDEAFPNPPDVGAVVMAISAPVLQPIAPGDTKNTLTWSAVSGATSYNLYWGTSSGITKASTQITGVTSAYDHTGRSNGTEYFYRVTALDADTESDVSNEESGTPNSAPPSDTKLFFGAN